MTAAVATKLAAADWTTDAKEALAAVDALYRMRWRAVRARLSRDGKIVNDLFEAEQHAAHGLAWLATYVRAVRELVGLCRARSAAEGRYGETEELLTRIGLGEYPRPDLRRHPDEPGRDRAPRRVRPRPRADRRAPHGCGRRG